MRLNLTGERAGKSWKSGEWDLNEWTGGSGFDRFHKHKGFGKSFALGYCRQWKELLFLQPQFLLKRV